MEGRQRGPATRPRDGGLGHVTIPDLVEDQVRRSPEATAVVAGEQQLTFAELDSRANQLAHHLQEHGVGPDVLVGICVERSVEMAIGLLGIVKAGGACVPLDPSYPMERLAFMVADSAVPVLVTQQHLEGRLPPGAATTVRLDADWDEVARHAPDVPRRALRPDHLAYVIYTSGSTGQPKGVMLPHRGLVNHNLECGRIYELGPDDRVLQFCSIGFDVSIEEIFPTWDTGGTVVFRPDDTPILGPAWLDWLRHRQVTVLNLPTAYWQEWVRDLKTIGETVPSGLRLVVVGGERALAPTYRAWLEISGEGTRWINAYGPTEASVMSTLYEPAREAQEGERDPPIGRPIANTTVHVLLDDGAPAPAGAVGELHIGGLGLARGYLNHPELTAARFVPDRFEDEPGSRLYRTGDLVRVLPDGNLEFVGRRDDQVKVRGFRIECGEVETALARHPDVAEVAVVAREDTPGDKRLVAYVVAGGEMLPSRRELRRFLSDRLPEYMVPTAFVGLRRLPKTPNGKLDRTVLPPPAMERDEATPLVAPRTATEAVISAIWARVLGIEGEVGVHDDFFELGGQSLLATQVIAQVREVFGREVPLKTIFEAPTVARLAAAVESGGGNGVAPPPLVAQPRASGERIPLSLPQEQMWALEVGAVPPGLYNVTVQHRFSGSVDPGALQRALEHVVERHEMLRTSFPTHAGRPFQSIADSVPVLLTVSDVGVLPPSNREPEVSRRIAEENARSFDLDVAPLFHAHLFHVAEDGDVLVVTFDHLISDGTSAYIFLSELVRSYTAFTRKEKPELRPIAVQYADFALWQRRWFTEERLQGQLEYWKQKLHSMPTGPTVPFDTWPETLTRRLGFRPFRVAPSSYEPLQRLARTSRSSLFVVCVAALQALFSRHSGESDIVLSTTLSGRHRAELEGLIGFFAGVGRLRTDLSGDPTFETLLSRARETVLGLFDHQDIPFMKVRAAVIPDFPVDQGGRRRAAVLPAEIHFVHAAPAEWVPGATWVERPPPHKGTTEMFLRGQLHPLSVTFLDDGTEMWGEFRYKVDFYRKETIEGLARGLERLLATVGANPLLTISTLPVDGT